TVVQEPSVSVSSGGTISLTCGLSSGGAQPEDEADYYCSLYLLPHLHAVSVSAGSLSQPVPTQPPSLSTSPGASARFTCTLSTGYSVGGYHIFWYQQKPGSSPRYLLSFRSDSDKHKGSGIPSRFSGSKDASANAGLLLIAGLQPEDEADYYCATVHSNTGTYTVLQTHRKVRLKAPLCPPPETVTAALPGPCLTQGATSQVVTRETSLSTTPGGTVTLICVSSSGAITTSSYASWVQQKPCQAPQGLIGGSSTRVPGPADPWSTCTMAWTPLLPLLTRYPGSWRFQRLVFGVIPLLLFLIPKMGLFLVSGASSQPLVTQEPSLWTVTLTCASSTGVVPSGHYPSWFQQKPGQVPRTLI
ncbi:hypothetical protein E2I00_016744, partial [Balaenoptera physalus]